MNNISTTLLELIKNGKACTQQEICAALLAKGFNVNQTKISRLLHKIGAIKVKDPSGKLVYHLAQEHAPPQKNRLIAELVLAIETNQHLIVVFTQPGCAAMIARLIDFHKKELGTLGTIAGDDTIFVAPTDLNKIAQVTNALKNLLLP